MVSLLSYSMLHLADLANRFHSLSVTGICQPHYETRVGWSSKDIVLILTLYWTKQETRYIYQNRVSVLVITSFWHCHSIFLKWKVVGIYLSSELGWTKLSSKTFKSTIPIERRGLAQLTCWQQLTCYTPSMLASCSELICMLNYIELYQFFKDGRNMWIYM